MKLQYGIFIGIIVVVMVTLCLYTYSMEKKMLSESIRSIEDVQKLFPTSPQDIDKDSTMYMQEAIKSIQAIIAVADDKRTFANTAKALDDLVSRSNIAIKSNVYVVVSNLHPDETIRNMAHDAVKKIANFFVDNVSNNKKLYCAFKAYAQGNAQHDTLTQEERYFIDETMKDFKRAGLELDDERLERVKDIKKRLSELSLIFERNIASDNRTICVGKEGLVGLSGDFIATLAKTDDGQCVVGVDYPTYFRIMEDCDSEDTRKRLYEAFSNRAYTANETVLKEIVVLRDELAKLLGFSSFAALNIANQMAQTPETVDSFLKDIRMYAQKKAEKELASFCQSLSPSVALTCDGKVKAWDLARLKTDFKKRNFDIDERKIAEYFPMQRTIDALLDIYQQFMGIQFKIIPAPAMWHQDVQLVEVYDQKSNERFGYLFLDLHPRPNKYSHAAHVNVVPAIKLPNDSRLPVVSVVIANFPKPSHDKPALLMRSDVSTFFHEFGHALHALLGATHMGSFAGTRVKTDFVEMPSQMLEEWLWDKDILQKVSCHYQTHEPLSDNVIENILALKQYDSGNHTVRQIMLAQYALDLYKDGADKNPETLWFLLLDQLLPHIYFGPEYRHYASFGHLTGYGSKYYGYMWSKVFALDLFAEIKKHGLLNAEIGARYIREVLGKGGSCDPNILLTNFLGRAPSQHAFLRDLGLII